MDAPLPALPAPRRDRARLPEGYGLPADDDGLLDWADVEARLVAAKHYWISSVRPDGRPHSIPRWGVWVDGRWWYDGAPTTQHARNAQRNPAVTLTLESGTQVVIVEGTSVATRAEADGLHAHVARQIGLIFRDARERDIAMIFLEHLEPSGWLGAPLEAVARQAGCSMAEAEAVITRLHEVEPAGLFARSLSECLRLQLEEAGDLTLPMARLLDVLPLLAKGDTGALLSHCEVDAEGLAALVTRLRRLDPKPGSHFDDAPDLRRAPDLIAERDELGQWHVELNSATAPRIAITPHGGAEHRAALKEARWLERTVSRRNALVLDVAAHVLSVQREFLEQGPVHLKPLSCADVAEKLVVHETTINRVRNGLLIQTPRGMMSMRAFFARGGTGHRDGSHVPAEAISARIADLIAAERPDKPLTDQQLATRLAEAGLRVSRRTVSNRRRMAGFPNAAERQISKGRKE
mgnify:CR=1 FL=1